MLFFRRASALVCALAFAMTAEATIIYDLAGDFSLASNPNGVWTYGHYTGGLDETTFAAFTGSETGVLGSLDIWRDSGTDDPNVILNTGATGVLCCGITFNADKVTFGPTGGPAVARLTADTAGTFLVEASFATVQSGNSIPNAYVFDGVVFNGLGAVPGSPSTVNYSALLNLAVGDIVDFVVSGLGNVKTTEVSATITQVPEPSTLGLLGAGLLGLFMRRSA